MSRVFVVDDHPLVAMVLAEQARAAFGVTDVEVAGCVDESIRRAQQVGVTVCVLDLCLPGCKGIDALLRFREAFPEARVVVVSAIEDRGVVLAALEAGAVGYIPKTSKASVVTSALRLVAEGGVYVPPQALEADAAVAPQDIHLTCRQMEVLRLISHGLANKEIAQSLRIAQETVKQHAKAVYAALGVRSRAQASRAAHLRRLKLD